MIEKIMEGLLSSGPIGCILAYFLWNNYKLTSKLFEVIEKNTNALSTNNDKLDALTKAQKQRRTEFNQTD